MRKTQKILFVLVGLMIITVTITLLIVTASPSTYPPTIQPNKTESADVTAIGSESTSPQIIATRSNDSNLIGNNDNPFVYGVVVGFLLNMMLMALLFFARHRNKENDDDELEEEIYREQMRANILGRMDILVERFSYNSEVIKDSRKHSENVLLPPGH